ncbi:MAG: hypothetical protein NTW32_17530 [Chloroflexi bacterium]|nr:hypothetical protein [Chloroflexota bacterium]
MIPVEIIFNPNWWHSNYGICFDEHFYLDRQTRIDSDVIMRKALYNRFGFGESNPQPRPVLGSMMVAGGFVLPALFGVPIRFSNNEAPWPDGHPMSTAEIMALTTPDLEHTWPMDVLLRDGADLQNSFGSLIGDFDLDGMFNTALHLRGQQLFVDLLDAPELIHHLFSILSETYIALVKLMRQLTGSCSIATNRSIIQVNPAIFLHSNCSICMVSPAVYEKTLLQYELSLANQLQPYGIHHCGNNLHRFKSVYGRIPAEFFDVGWGSDVHQCRQAWPNAFLNLRLSPVRMLQNSASEIYQDTFGLLQAAGAPQKVGVCCINMDAGTPDENIKEMIRAVSDYSKTIKEL